MRSAPVWLCILVACGGGNDHPVDSTGGPARCGDGVKSGTEMCDGTDIGAATCESAVAPGWVGGLACTETCELNVAACNPPNTMWSAFNDATKWSTFDVSSLFAGAKGFHSAAFDGRYLYFLPQNNGAPDGLVARYDTSGGFGASGSWETFDIATVNGTAKGFIGAAFDGRYLYFVPYNNGGYDGVAARYDTTAMFGDASSWSTFDIATVDASARGFAYATFDGRYIYFAPHYNGVYHGDTARYDTQGDFTAASSWTTFDMSTLNPAAKGFLGAQFDGRYVYYVPYYNNVAYHGTVTRYDTHSSAGFTSAASWTTFNVASTNANAVGFYSYAFDGRYLYLGQYYDGAVPDYGGWIVRYDTQAQFTDAASWSSFNAATVNTNARGYIGGEFDGRYVYFVPHYNSLVLYSGVALRYDTQGTSFGAAASWSTFDTATVNGNAHGFAGGGFDGRYIYYVPSSNATTQLGVIARFDAKSPSWLPVGWSRAFN